MGQSMSQLAFLALAALVGWMLWRNITPPLARQKRAVERSERHATTLERDPVTGIYRPTDRGE